MLLTPHIIDKMPSKRKGSSVASVTSADEDDEDYRTKRDRNNQVSKHNFVCQLDFFSINNKCCFEGSKT